MKTTTLFDTFAASTTTIIPSTHDVHTKPTSLLFDAEDLAGSLSVRRSVFAMALQSDEPFSSADLVERCQSLQPPVSRATVYRNLKLLLDRGLLTVVTLKNRERLYQPASEQPEVLWICENCSQVSTFEAESIVAQLLDLARQNGLSAQTVTVKIHARCADKNCRRSD